MINFSKQFMRGGRRLYCTAFVLSWLAILFWLVLPQIVNVIIDFVLAYTPASNQKLYFFGNFFVDGKFGPIQSATLLIWLLIFYGIFAVLKGASKFGSDYLFNLAGVKFTGNARKSGLNKLFKMPEIKNPSQTFLCLTSDISYFRDGWIVWLPKIIEKNIVAILSTLLVFAINYMAGIVLLIVIICVFVSNILFFKESRKQFALARRNEEEISKVTQDNIDCIKDIKTFGYSKIIANKFEKINKGYSSIKNTIYKLCNLSHLVANVLRALIYGFVIIFGGLKAFDGDISVGNYVTLISYCLIAMEALISITQSMFEYNNAMVFGQRYKSFMQNQSNVIDFTGKENITDIQEIKFENIELSLSKKIFNGLTFCVKKGQSLGILSNQGAGKSQLLRLIERLENYQSGQIFINGKKIENYEITSLRNGIGYVAEKPFIFEGTILDNLSMYETLPKQEANNIADCICLNKYISKQKKHFNTLLSENGVEIPNQEKMQICLGRALKKQKSLVLLDSPFVTFAENKTKQLINNILEYKKDSIVIIVSNRPQDVEFCDNIAVLKDGKIVEFGTKNMLLSEKTKFKEAYEIKEKQES